MPVFQAGDIGKRFFIIIKGNTSVHIRQNVSKEMKDKMDQNKRDINFKIQTQFSKQRVLSRKMSIKDRAHF